MSIIYISIFVSLSFESTLLQLNFLFYVAKEQQKTLLRKGFSLIGQGKIPKLYGYSE